VKHQVSQLYQNSKQDYGSVYLNLFVSYNQQEHKTIMGSTAARYLQIQPALNFFMSSPKYFNTTTF